MTTEQEEPDYDEDEIRRIASKPITTLTQDEIDIISPWLRKSSAEEVTRVIDPMRFDDNPTRTVR